MDRKIVFDAVRAMLARGFRPDEVAALDTALDEAVGQRRIGAAGIALIKRFEGCARLRPDGRVEAYPDPGTGGDPWTIGWGATGPGIVAGTIWTQEQCDARLTSDLLRYAGEVARAIRPPPPHNSMRWCPSITIPAPLRAPR